MIKSIYCPPGQPVQKDLSTNNILSAHKRNDGLLWVSLENASNQEIASILRDIFNFHPLAIEDSSSEGYQTPKIDDFGNYIFILTHAIPPFSGQDHLDSMELNIFLGNNYLVTSYVSEQMPPVKTLWDRINRDERIINHGSADFLCHAILDILVDDYMPILDQLDDEIEFLEDRVLEKSDPQLLEDILHIKHSMLTLRRIITPQREILNRLSRGDFPQIQPDHRIYFRDIYDHVVRIQDLTESIRDIIFGTLDTYLSVTSNRLNEVMKALTIVSTVFLPLTFFAGLWGMNFEFMPEIHWKYGYLMAWAVFISLLGIMVYIIKRRRWY